VRAVRIRTVNALIDSSLVVDTCTSFVQHHARGKQEGEEYLPCNKKHTTYYLDRRQDIASSTAYRSISSLLLKRRLILQVVLPN